MKQYSRKSTLLFLIFSLFTLVVNAQVSSQKIKQDAEAVQNYFNYVKSTRQFHPPLALPNLPTKESMNQWLGKTTADFVDGQKSFVMNGNNVTVELMNYGGIAAGLPAANIRELNNLVWRKLPYIFQFCPIVGASVPNAKDGSRLHIITDGLFDYDGYRDESPTGYRYVWRPLAGYDDPAQSSIASNPAFDSDHDGKPDSWPREWYNATLGEYVWPGYLTQGVNNADLECLWAMDDHGNKEFPYYPYLSDTTLRGAGIQINARAFQWSNSLAANTLFMVYTITNKSDKDLDSVLFGIYGDPDIGGKDNKDDNGFFIPPYGASVANIPVYARSMVYFWDPDMKGDRGLPLGYLGCKFLESPGNGYDAIDNDGDGMTDERQDDGIDNDHDWVAETDDVGVDGIPGTGDAGEADGLPTAGIKLADGTLDPLHAGEPNYEFTDLDEADQIGLTSFNSWTWGEDKIYNDESIWQRCTPGEFGDIAQSADIAFVFGSGYISLKKGETKRISMAFLFGQDLNDLLTSATTVQDIYNKNYRFFKPPDAPKVTAVPDDKKVTLYWNTKAEESLDPITGKDFEGYVIYRSTDAGFSDILKITDGRGADFLYEPLKDTKGFDAKWDVVNEWKGYHPVAYQGKGTQFYLGDNNGLVHSFVDSNNVINGQKYFYAVVAYDHGDSLGIPPSESTKKITLDAATSQYRFDANTVMVTPGPRASGYMAPAIPNQNVQHVSGVGNGTVTFSILNDLEVKDNNYRLTFKDTLFLADTSYKMKNYSVTSDLVVTEDVWLFDYKFAKLSNSNIYTDASLVVKDGAGKTYTNNVDYVLDAEKGTLRRKENGTMANNSKFSVTYKYYPVYQSTALSGEDANPVFEGIKVKVSSYTTLQPDPVRTKWVNSRNIPWTVAITTITGPPKFSYPGDYQLTYLPAKTDSTYILVGSKLVAVPANFKVEEISTGVPKKVLTFLRETEKKDSIQNRGEELIFFKPGALYQGSNKDTLTWAVVYPKVVGDTLLPIAGDVFNISIQRPFEKADVFTLKTSAGKVSNSLASNRMKDIYVVPNPYVVANALEPANRLQTQNRGERRIYFENLPMQCTIRIYTLSGELVQQLEHDQMADNGREYWNLLNKDGFSVAYGVYLAHIDAPGIGKKLIKFALIK